MAKKNDDAKTATDDQIVIKKYANRRLYNTAKSSYVTLENLSEMVREGQDFVVRDAKSGEDITRSVLTQIIFEEEAKGQNMLPTKFLRQLIQLYGDSLQGFVPTYLEASMETFARNQDEMRDKITQAFGANPAMANFEALTKSNMEFFESSMKMFAPFTTGMNPLGGAPAPERAPAKEAPAAPVQKDEELEALKQQLSQMQDQLSKLIKD